LLLRKPSANDAGEIYSRYASDPEVTRFLTWPTARVIGDVEQFLSVSAAEWERWPAGPYLIVLRSDGTLLGGTGYAFESPRIATTGYVLARDAWGFGYATETLTAILRTAPDLGIERLSTHCHEDHAASIRVLRKCGFTLEERITAEFPNLGTGRPEPCLRFVWPPAESQVYLGNVNENVAP
jgi:ribosomal-protein-alanine N-acetyltransferase